MLPRELSIPSWEAAQIILLSGLDLPQFLCWVARPDLVRWNNGIFLDVGTSCDDAACPNLLQGYQHHVIRHQNIQPKDERT